jgi:hypothetical protein
MIIFQIVEGSLSVTELFLSNIGKGVSGVTLHLSLVPSSTVPSNAAILISLATSAPQTLSSNTVSFSSPMTGASATASLLNNVIIVQMSSGSFGIGELISLTLPGTVTNAGNIQPSMNNVSVSIVDVSGCILALNNSVFFRSIIDGSLGSNMPSINLNDWTAGGSGVSMTISFTPSFEIPPMSSILITLSGSAPQSLFSSNIVFVSPSVGIPSASASLISNGVLSIFLESGNFTVGQNITLRLPGTVQNCVEPRSARNDISAAVIDSHGVVLCKSSSGTMHSIVDGRLDVGINFDWRGHDAAAVSLFASIIPYCDILSGSSIIISLAGSAPASLSAQSVAFRFPATGSISAIANLADGVITVTLITGVSSSGELIQFSLPGTIKNAAKPQPFLNNVSVSIVDRIGVIRSVNRSVFFHAIHDSYAALSHSLTGYAASSAGVKTFGSFRIQGAAAANALVFTYPMELFVSSRCSSSTYVLHVYFVFLCI